MENKKIEIRRAIDHHFSLVRYDVIYEYDGNNQLLKEFHIWIRKNFPNCDCWKYGKMYVIPKDDQDDFELAVKLIYGCEIYELN